MERDEKRQLEELQLVVFTIGEDEFGVDILSVQEIIKMPEITEVPDVPDYVNGIINLRGQIVTVMDLKKKLGGVDTTKTSETRIMIVNIHETIIGMVVDSVSEVMRIAKDDISPPPKNLTTKIHQDFIDGVGKVEERLIILLNLEGVLLKDDIEELNAEGTPQARKVKEKAAENDGKEVPPKSAAPQKTEAKEEKSAEETEDTEEVETKK